VLPVLAVMAVAGALVVRDRDRVPALLRRVTAHLDAGERVDGDGLGADRRARPRSAVPTVLAATDRRLLLASAGGVAELPYDSIARFSVGWRAYGRIGELAVVVGGDRRVFGSIAPANLLSIARALHAHGVEAEDPDALAEAELAWEQALAGKRPREAFFDRAAMTSRDFDRGLWLLLALCALIFYPSTIGVGFGGASVTALLVAMPIACAICGYVSRTRSSLAYLVPLNLLLTPTFLFAPTGGVVVMMFALSALAAVALRAGAALGARRDRPPAGAAVAAGGSLRDAIGARSLIRISAVLLGLIAAGVTTGTAAGVELNTLHRPAVERLPADGRSNLSGGAASLRYTNQAGLDEVVTDEHLGAGPSDGARWELRSSPADPYHAVTLSHYVFDDPRLDDEAAVAGFVAGKDADHSELAGSRVTHTERVVDGRRGYVWDHDLPGGGWNFTAWFPHPVDSVRLECYTRDRRQTDRFKRLCAEAVRSLSFSR